MNESVLLSPIKTMQFEDDNILILSPVFYKERELTFQTTNLATSFLVASKKLLNFRDLLNKVDWIASVFSLT